MSKSSSSNATPDHAAWALLLDALSVSFAYPDMALYQAMADGSYARALREVMSGVTAGASLDTALTALEAGLAWVRESDREQLETDYMALFEANRNQAPCHLYAHLYPATEGGAETQLEMLRRLQGIYRAQGAVLKSGAGADQPDHLAVQLEFLAFLHQAAAESRAAGLAERERKLIAFGKELDWVTRFTPVFARRSAHPVYTPLVSLLDEVVRLHHASFPTPSG